MFWEWNLPLYLLSNCLPESFSLLFHSFSFSYLLCSLENYIQFSGFLVSIAFIAHSPKPSNTIAKLITTLETIYNENEDREFTIWIAGRWWTAISLNSSKQFNLLMKLVVFIQMERRCKYFEFYGIPLQFSIFLEIFSPQKFHNL